MISGFIWTRGYIALLLIGAGSGTLFTAVLLIEILSWIFVRMADRVSLKYLLIQSFFFFLRFMAIMTWERLLLVVFLVKIGLPPFHTWALQVFSFLNKAIFFFIRTIHKLLPLVFIIRLSSGIMCLLVFTIILTLSLLILPSVSSIFLVLAVSSIIHTGWLIIGGGSSLRFFLTYWILYLALVSLLLYSTLTVSEVQVLQINQSLASSRTWLVISGFPPLLIFWLKVMAIITLIHILFRGVLTVIRLLVLSLVAYFRIFILGKLSEEIKSPVLIPFIVSLAFYFLY